MSINQIYNKATDSVYNNKINKILYTTDLTDSSPRVYQYALYLARQFNAEIVCLHVIERYTQSATMRYAMYYLTEEDKRKILTRERNKALEIIAERNRQTFIRQQFGNEGGLYPEELGLNIVNKVVFGGIEEQILRHSVISECDLIVMGAHEKPFYTFTTNLSKRVMKRSKVPVTVVPITGERKHQSTGLLPSLIPGFSTT